MDIRPIKTDNDYRKALLRIEELMAAAPDSEAGTELDVLATLVEAYEAKHFPIEASDPVDAILFRMEQMGLGRKDLEPLLGSKGRVSPGLITPRTKMDFRSSAAGAHPALTSRRSPRWDQT